MLTKEDLLDFDPDEPVQPLLHTVFRVTTNAERRLDAMTSMLGTGTSLQMLSPLAGDKLLLRWKDLFLAQIRDRAFRIFPWYVPMLEKKDLVEPVEELMLESLEGVSLYIRESPEDGGILIISAAPLDESFTLLGSKRIAEGPSPVWRFAEQA